MAPTLPTVEARAGELLERAHAASDRGLHARAASIALLGLDLSPPALFEVPLRELRARSLAALERYGDAADELARVHDLAPEDDGERDARLGEYLLRARRPERALEALARASGRAPERADFAVLLADAQVALGLWAEAASSYRRVARVRPTDRAIRVSLAKALDRAHDAGAAEPILDECLREEPDDVRALVARARVRLALGDPERASTDAERAVSLAPDDAESHLAWAYARLALGDWAAGFRAYEWRLVGHGRRPRLGVPAWDGDDPAGTSIVVWTEQGHGDVLHFVRYVPWLAERGARVVLSAPRRLVRLLRSCDSVGEIAIQGGTLPVGHRYVTLMSLPHLLSRAPAGGDRAYLRAEPALVARWKTELADRTARAVPAAQVRPLRVALAWQGNPAYDADRARSMPLATLEPLLSLSQRPELDVAFFSVQKNFGREQIAGLPSDVQPIDLGLDVDAGDDAFVDTAAVLSSVDLVITTDTAIAHLAGALAIPAWVLLSAAPEWRWGMRGGATPWYRSLRLYRQSRLDDWASAVGAVRRDLERLARERR